MYLYLYIYIYLSICVTWVHGPFEKRRRPDLLEEPGCAEAGPGRSAGAQSADRLEDCV